jgi:hypothetical protein
MGNAIYSGSFFGPETGLLPKDRLLVSYPIPPPRPTPKVLRKTRIIKNQQPEKWRLLNHKVCSGRLFERSIVYSQTHPGTAQLSARM